MRYESSKFTLYGSRKDIDKAVEILSRIPGLDEMRTGEARVLIQDTIGKNRLKARILYDGKTIYDMDRILNNLKRIIKHGRLFGKTRIRFIPLGSMLCMPATPRDFKPILSKYFYEFLHLQCGSIAHYNRAGWIAHYPYLEDLKEFFKKNEYGRPVRESVTLSDRKRIVEEIERLLFPFQAFMKQRKKDAPLSASGAG